MDSNKINVNDYKQYSFKDFSKLHQMTAYLAMFPPNIPYYFIQHYSQKGDLVFDPFSGRGTTAFEACRMGRIGIGNDLNPLAVCLTRAKVSIPKKESILKRVKELKLSYKSENIKDVQEDIKMLYEETLTLPQLLYLKNNLRKKEKLIILFLRF